MADCEVAIIGAGPAGLLAAQTLIAQGVQVRILEARDRIGGRAFTERTSLGVPFDRGASWLHRATDNPWVGEASRQRRGLRGGNPPERIRIAGQWLSADEQADHTGARRDACTALFNDAIDNKDSVGADHLSASGATEAVADWTTWTTGVMPDELSTADWARLPHTAPPDMLVAGGVGRLIRGLGRRMAVQKNTAVTRIQWAGKSGAILETSAGPLTAETVIITVPPSVMRSGRLAFDPALPEPMSAALNGLQMGQVEKIGLRYPGATLAGDGGLVVADHEPSDGRPYCVHLGTFGKDVAVVFVAGDVAKTIAQEDPRHTAAWARWRVRSLLGPIIDAKFKRATVTNWGKDPWAGGAVSAALPGQSHQRAAMDAGLGGRVFFAGEAWSLRAPTTLTGAWETGVRAARQALSALGR